MNQGYGRQKIFDGYLDSSIYPSESKMLLDDIKLKGNFKINGAIYGHNIEIKGKGSVNGPIMAKEELVIYPPTTKEDQMLFSAGMSSRKIISVKVPQTSSLSPATDPDFAPLVIKGDLCSNVVHLDNALVLGNIHCNDAYIRNSIILGIPIAQNKLELTNTAVIAFDAKVVNLYGRNTLWLPYGIASDGVSFMDIDEKYHAPATSSKEDQVEGAHIAWLRYVGLCRSKHGCGEGFIACERFNTGTCPFPDTRMRHEDILEMNFRGENVHVATLATRFMDTRKIEKEIKAIADILAGTMLFTHFDEKSKAMFLERARKRREGPIIDKIVDLANLFAEFDETVGNENSPPATSPGDEHS